MDYYEVLGVDKNSSPAEIKKKYRKLSLQYHPDKNNGDDTKFKKINEAYQTLSDREKRKRYDLQQNNPFFSAMNGGNRADIPADIFKMFFGVGMPGMQGMHGGMPGMPPNIRIFHNGARVPFMRKPPPIVKTITISLEDAYVGINYPLEIERWVDENGVKTVEKERLYIPIPEGIDNNEILQLPKKGNILNGIKGDIKLPISVENNTKFKRQGLNLYYRKKLTLKEALIGFSFDLNFLQGKSYTINNNSGRIISYGYKKVVPKMGMKRDNAVGNLYIEFDIVFPSKLSEEQIEKLAEIL